MRRICATFGMEVIMSNTPLTQLVRLHRLYWLKVKGLKDSVPNLG